VAWDCSGAVVELCLLASGLKSHRRNAKARHSRRETNKREQEPRAQASALGARRNSKDLVCPKPGHRQAFADNRRNPKKTRGPQRDWSRKLPKAPAENSKSPSVS
jgi:hypothetical protein